MRTINAADAPASAGGYAQAVEVPAGSKILYLSGQIPVTTEGHVPTTFADQCRQCWANVEAQLRAAGLGVHHLVKVTTFLSDRRYADENGTIRREVLAGHTPALTVIITGIFDPAWLLEIEAIAASDPHSA